MKEGSADSRTVRLEKPQVEGAGTVTALSHHRPLHLALSTWLLPGPGASVSHPLIFLQCLKVGGTSVKPPVIPSFLTAQGKWR